MMKPYPFVTADRFAGFPISAFAVSERRSLTVHIEDAGKFDVLAPGCCTDPEVVSAGRFDTFGEASTVADGLNRVWRTAPQATAAEVVGFVMQERGTFVHDAALLEGALRGLLGDVATLGEAHWISVETARRVVANLDGRRETGLPVVPEVAR